ncbi:MAG TPA: O-antigen ligase family protein [Candidatus Limnocylindria bacterium]|nr:O-antigen ligase family protein [Candidatus Limnocylindria bacterium]
MTMPRSWLAWVSLALAAAVAIAFEPGPWQLVLAAAATLLLSRDPRLGPLPAAMLVVLALPYDRAANNDLLRIAGLPLRPQDMAIGLGVVLALPYLRWPRVSAPLVAIAAFLAVGVGALWVGYVSDYPLRDVFRDARWWFMYATGLLALATSVRRSQVLRALLWGSVVFALIALATTVLPPFPGGLKERSLIFDIGTLRMQFGNSIFLLPALALALWQFLRSPNLSRGAIAWLLMVAVTLSLTRTYVAVVALSGLAVLVVAALTSPRPGALARSVAAGGVLVLALVGGIGLNLGHSVVGDTLSRLMPVPSDPPTRAPGVSAIDRFLFEGERAGVGPIVQGRFATYASAVNVILRSPLTGLGLGTLVEVEYAFGGDPFATPGYLPNVDNAYLTVGLKAGAVGIAAFAAMLLSLPLALLRERRLRRLAPWLLPALGGVLVLTLTQSFATTGYSPFGLSLLLVLGGLGYASSNAARARAQE